MLHLSPSLPSTPQPLPAVEAELSYLRPMGQKPVYYVVNPPPGVICDNAKYDSHRLPIHNARLSDLAFSLDQEGFQLVQQASALGNFYDEDNVQRRYYPEAEQLLKQLTGANTVIVFDHNLRNARQFEQGQPGIQPPVERVHNDFTTKSGYSRARLVLENLGISATHLLQQRFAVINLWRPIAPVQRSPLAICNARTIAAADWVARDLIYRDRIGETYAVPYNPAHQWFYFPHMQPAEALVFKCFDSATKGIAQFTAHTAFSDPAADPNAPLRESIELRALAFYNS